MKNPRAQAPSQHYITSYERLDQYLRAFADGYLNLLILIGAGGLAKSRSVRRALGTRPTCWIEGNATPFGIYAKLYQHRDQFVVIDDVDGIYADRAGVRLLKCLCQTEPKKSIAWHSDARSLERQGIPREFTTTSKVIIIANDWKTLDKNVAALQDRGHVLHFRPGVAEVHRKAGEWLSDTEIHQWFEANLHRLHELSLRQYVRASELKAAGMDWTEVIARDSDNPRLRLTTQLLKDPAYQSTGARVQAFIDLGGGCRATYFNYCRRLVES